MKRWLVPLVLVACVMVACVMAVWPQGVPCGPAGEVEQQIASEFGESIVGAGITEAGVVFITANPETGGFTVMLRGPDGLTCLLAAGMDWTFIKPGRVSQIGKVSHHG